MRLWQSVNVLGKVAQYRLPRLSLLFNGVFRFGVESYAHGDTCWSRDKFDRSSAVSEGIFNQLVWHYLGIRSSKVEADDENDFTATATTFIGLDQNRSQCA